MDDIPYLASHFRDQFAREAGFPVVPFSRESIDWLASHEWPGNVRELKHAVERAIVLSRGADEISPSHFGYGTGPIGNGPDGSLLRHVRAGWDLRRMEEAYIRAVIYHTDGLQQPRCDLFNSGVVYLLQGGHTREDIMVDRRRAPAFVVILPKNARTGIEPSAAPRSVPIETLLKGELMDGSP